MIEYLGYVFWGEFYDEKSRPSVLLRTRVLHVDTLDLALT